MAHLKHKAQLELCEGRLRATKLPRQRWRQSVHLLSSYLLLLPFVLTLIVKPWKVRLCQVIKKPGVLF